MSTGTKITCRECTLFRPGHDGICDECASRLLQVSVGSTLFGHDGKPLEIRGVGSVTVSHSTTGNYILSWVVPDEELTPNKVAVDPYAGLDRRLR